MCNMFLISMVYFGNMFLVYYLLYDIDRGDKVAGKGNGFKIGVDLGTANTLVYINGYGVIFNEPSIVAFDRKSGDLIAAGTEAYAMLGKTHDHIKVVKPMEGGVISDIDGTNALMIYALSTLENINIDYSKSTLLICCPSEISSIERVAMIDLAKKLGMNDVFIEEEVKAGAIGAGLDIYSTTGSMVIDIGGGTTDIGIMALGDLVVSESLRVAGNFFDREIIKYVKLKYHIAIGTNTAERVKINIGTVRRELEEDREITIAGRNLKTGLPNRITLKQSEIQFIFLGAFENIANIAVKVLQQAPPELSADIFNNGLVINGGGSNIDGSKEFFEERLRLKVKQAKNPLTSIVEGSKILLQNRGNYLIKPVD